MVSRQGVQEALVRAFLRAPLLLLFREKPFVEAVMVMTKRIAASVPDYVVATWTAAAKAQGLSLSGLIAQWMTELEPGFAELVRIHAAMQAADAEQRERIRREITVLADAALPLVDNAVDALSKVDTDRGKHA